jgi:hypothetical protein
MWVEVGLSIAASAIAVVCVVKVVFRRGSQARWIDVGPVSGGWLVEHRCSRPNSST